MKNKHPLFSGAEAQFRGVKITPPNWFVGLLINLKCFWWRVRNKKRFLKAWNAGKMTSFGESLTLKKLIEIKEELDKNSPGFPTVVVDGKEYICFDPVTRRMKGFNKKP